MASTIVRALLPPSSGTVTLNLYEPGSTTLANTGGDTATEGTGGKGYEWTVTEALAGLYLARLLDSGGSEIGSGAVVLADDTGPYYLGDPVSVSSASQASVDSLAGNVETLQSSVTALSGTELSSVSPVGTDGAVRVYRARDYDNDDGLALEWSNSAGTWPDLTGATIHVRLGMPGCSTTALYQFDGSAPTPSGANQTVRLELTDADLSIRPDDYTYNVVATLASGNAVQLYTGSWSVLFALEAPAA